MKHNNKTWYEITVATKNNEKVFKRKDGTMKSYDMIARVKSKGLAYVIADKLKEVYSGDLYIIVVE